MPHPGNIITTEATEDVWNFENEWSNDLCDCCTNVSACCFAHFCFPCFLCKLFSRTNEFACTPMCVSGSLMTLRTKLRTGFRIKGSICNDCICTLFCPICVALQMSKELELQGL